MGRLTLCLLKRMVADHVSANVLRLVAPHSAADIRIWHVSSGITQSVCARNAVNVHSALPRCLLEPFARQEIAGRLIINILINEVAGNVLYTNGVSCTAWGPC